MNDQTTEQQPANDPALKDPAAVALGRKGGLAGTGSKKARGRKKMQRAAHIRWLRHRQAAASDTTSPAAPSSSQNAAASEAVTKPR